MPVIVKNPLVEQLCKAITSIECEDFALREGFSGEVLVITHTRLLAAAVLTLSNGNLSLTRKLAEDIITLLEEDLNIGLSTTGNIDQSAHGKVM